MDHLTAWGLSTATAHQREMVAERIVDQAWQCVRPQFITLLAGLLGEALSPSGVLRFEQALVVLVRELGRLVIQATLNALEPDSPEALPQDLWFESSGYRRRTKKTRNAHVATLFGTIVLWRLGYRSWERTEGSIFPLEMLLGLTEGVTPGLTDWLGRQMAAAGASQKRVLQTLRAEHGVAMGVERLRLLTKELSRGMAEFRQVHQVQALLEALQIAQESRGGRKPVLAVGRDGITLREYRYSFYEVATAATVSVYDRSGKRLITVYLAHPPELGQATMSRMLTSLLTELLERWQGPLPQLAYVADSGGNESNYYEETLRRMLHPRTGKPLSWQRVVDYYHVAERVWTMSSLLFGKDTQAAYSWAIRMLKNLKRPSGPSRVLHSAASHFHRRKWKPTAEKDFWKAYRYLQKRTQFMRYHEYARRHIPLGSGVTEAACKTIFTQRLKLSGMRWSHDGAAAILSLRVPLLSGTWKPTFDAYLKARQPTQLRPYGLNTQTKHKIAV